MSDPIVEALKERVAHLEGRVDQLEDALIGTLPVPIEWKLTASESRVLGVLVNREIVTKDAILAALYRDTGKDEAEAKIVDVFICKLRKKLRDHGPLITTIYGTGYSLDLATRERLRRAS